MTTFRTTLWPGGGNNAETRKVTGRGAGDEVEVTLEVDDQPRTVDPPEALAVALADNPEAADAWAALSYSKQRQHAESIAGAKTDETLRRRLARALEALTAD